MAALEAEVNRARQHVLADPDRLRTENDPDERVRVPEDALETDASYDNYLGQLRTEVPIQWQWELRFESRISESGLPSERVVSMELVNISPMPCNNSNNEAFFFDTRARFDLSNCEVLPFETGLTPRNFRYDRDSWGRGINCAIECLRLRWYCDGFRCYRSGCR